MKNFKNICKTIINPVVEARFNHDDMCARFSLKS